jgi:hypothetical protein
VIGRAFHNWERRLASVDTNRRVRPFAWGLDWIGLDGTANGDDPASTLAEFAAATVERSDEFFSAPPTSDYSLEGDALRFPSAIITPHAENNTVVGRVFPADPRRAGPRRRAVVVLPQWNADSEGHVGLCQLFARFGVTSVRLSMPYHDARRPKDLERADFIVSPNIGQTLQVNRQAVLDARRIVDWLDREGFDSIGIVGTSLGSCLSMLTMAHEPRLKAGAFNHVSPYFADVVWSGLSTAHVRAGLEGHVDIERLRRMWMPISPWPYVERVRGRSVLLIYARYDLTFPVPLSKKFVDRFRQLEIPHQTAVLPCGHYTTGKSPFKFIDGYHLTRFLVKAL